MKKYNEIRLDDKDKEDDIVIDGVDIHLENMNDRCWWLGVYKGNKRNAFWICTKRGKITVRLDENELKSKIVPYENLN